MPFFAYKACLLSNSPKQFSPAIFMGNSGLHTSCQGNDSLLGKTAMFRFRPFCKR